MAWHSRGRGFASLRLHFVSAILADPQLNYGPNSPGVARVAQPRSAARIPRRTPQIATRHLRLMAGQRVDYDEPVPRSSSRPSLDDLRWAGVVLLGNGTPMCVAAPSAELLCARASAVEGGRVLYLARLNGEPLFEPMPTPIPLPTDSLPL